jgi:hypothetical protein
VYRVLSFFLITLKTLNPEPSYTFDCNDKSNTIMITQLITISITNIILIYITYIITIIIIIIIIIIKIVTTMPSRS